MRFLSSSALASAEKLRLAASCSAAETIARSCPPAPRRRRRNSIRLACRPYLTNPYIGALLGRSLAFGGLGFRLALAFAALALALALGGCERHALVLASGLVVGDFLGRSQDFHRAAGLLDRLDRRLRGAVDRERSLGLELAMAE